MTLAYALLACVLLEGAVAIWAHRRACRWQRIAEEREPRRDAQGRFVRGRR